LKRLFMMALTALTVAIHELDVLLRLLPLSIGQKVEFWIVFAGAEEKQDGEEGERGRCRGGKMGMNSDVMIQW
jgi:hypothetical protein